MREVTRMKKKIGFLIVLIALGQTAFSQKTEFKGANQFYGELGTHVLFCQLDGDGASGYNKFGLQVQGLVGFTLNKQEAIEFSLGISERGSRKGIDPENSDFRIFHIRHQWLETGVYYARYYKGVLAHAGLRGTYLIAAEESEGFDPNIESGMRKLGALAELGLRYPLNENWSVSANASYSVLSLLKNDNSSILPNSVYRSAGLFSNNIGIGIIFTP